MLSNFKLIPLKKVNPFKVNWILTKMNIFVLISFKQLIIVDRYLTYVVNRKLRKESLISLINKSKIKEKFENPFSQIFLKFSYLSFCKNVIILNFYLNIVRIREGRWKLKKNFLWSSFFLLLYLFFNFCLFKQIC